MSHFSYQKTNTRIEENDAFDERVDLVVADERTDALDAQLELLVVGLPSLLLLLSGRCRRHAILARQRDRSLSLDLVAVVIVVVFVVACHMCPLSTFEGAIFAANCFTNRCLFVVDVDVLVIAVVVVSSSRSSSNSVLVAVIIVVVVVVVVVFQSDTNVLVDILELDVFGLVGVVTLTTSLLLALVKCAAHQRLVAFWLLVDVFVLLLFTTTARITSATRALAAAATAVVVVVVVVVVAAVCSVEEFGELVQADVRLRHAQHEQLGPAVLHERDLVVLRHAAKEGNLERPVEYREDELDEELATTTATTAFARR